MKVTTELSWVGRGIESHLSNRIKAKGANICKFCLGYYKQCLDVSNHESKSFLPHLYASESNLCLSMLFAAKHGAAPLTHCQI